MAHKEMTNQTQIELSKKLREISGIVFNKEGKLFCHDDERAAIYQIDPFNGEILKVFTFGLFVKRGDFEDITMAGDTFYMVESDGRIYEFREGADKEQVDYKVYETDLDNDSNVEGICYDPDENTLLLALKGKPGDGLDEKDNRAVYSFSLATKKLNPRPRFVLDKNIILKESKEKDFAPSAITYNPANDHFYITAAVGNIMVEINRQGKIVSLTKLNRKLHEQPEGIAFKDSQHLYISDEGKKHGTLTIYEID
ncbi:MAG: SdiA-regulated domain-containing protein [Calditrichaeota bacterium]|nr:SdiA-regulated domain-containing protein [Calditrichota bacterium]